MKIARRACAIADTAEEILDEMYGLRRQAEAAAADAVAAASAADDNRGGTPEAGGVPWDDAAYRAAVEATRAELRETALMLTELRQQYVSGRESANQKPDPSVMGILLDHDCRIDSAYNSAEDNAEAGLWASQIAAGATAGDTDRLERLIEIEAERRNVRRRLDGLDRRPARQPAA